MGADAGGNEQPPTLREATVGAWASTWLQRTALAAATALLGILAAAGPLAARRLAREARASARARYIRDFPSLAVSRYLWAVEAVQAAVRGWRCRRRLAGEARGATRERAKHVVVRRFFDVGERLCYAGALRRLAAMGFLTHAHFQAAVRIQAAVRGWLARECAPLNVDDHSDEGAFGEFDPDPYESDVDAHSDDDYLNLNIARASVVAGAE